MTGNYGASGLGAVVGATYPGEAQRLREILPTNLFLIPGFGTQGGGAKDAAAGYAGAAPAKAYSLVNASRALLSGFDPVIDNEEKLISEIRARSASFTASLNQ